MAIYPAIYNGPPRHYGSTRTDKRYIAIHNTSNDATAEGEASYAKRREDSVSSHYYVDSDSIVQSLDTALRAYHAGSTIGNSQAIAYEITGTNGKSRAWWLANVAWALLARQIAADCREHAIEPRLLTVDEIKAGSKTGIITHDQMRQAWGGTTHTDPGANFPLTHLLALVRAELNGEDADMATFTDEHARMLSALYYIVFFGGSSGGDPVAAEYVRNNEIDPKTGKRGVGQAISEQWRNGIVSQLAELRATAGGDVDEAALAAALAPLLEGGATPAEVAAAVRAELDKTRLVGG